jgi:hypothetical protein
MIENEIFFQLNIFWQSKSQPKEYSPLKFTSLLNRQVIGKTASVFSKVALKLNKLERL